MKRGRETLIESIQIERNRAIQFGLKNLEIQIKKIIKI